MKRTVFMLVLALLAAQCAAALAVPDGVVEEAPLETIAPEGATAARNDVLILGRGAGVSDYMPDPNYYAGQTYAPEWAESDEWVDTAVYENGELFIYRAPYGLPALTPGELRRYARLKAEYDAGMYPDVESIIGPRENVVLGVYPLDPNQYDGESVYTLLPCTCLTDEQLIQLIAAYSSPETEFSPELLSYRNCMRGGGIESTRFYAEEERARQQVLIKALTMGQIDTGYLAPSDCAFNVSLDALSYCNLEGFRFKPYRSMTDDEIVASLVSDGLADYSELADMNKVERLARGQLHGWLGQPLSMELRMMTAAQRKLLPIRSSFDDYLAETGGALLELMQLSFSYPGASGDNRAAAWYTAGESNIWAEFELDFAAAQPSSPEPQPGGFELEDYISAAARFARDELGIESAAALEWELFETGIVTNYGSGHYLIAECDMPDGSRAELSILLSDSDLGARYCYLINLSLINESKP